MSHELRTPLNAVIGFSDVLLEKYHGELNFKQTEYIQVIQSSGHKLLGMINSVLDLFKMDAGQFKLEKSEFEVIKVLNLVHSIFAISAKNKNIEFTNTSTGYIGHIYADERAFKQILLNLIENAIKFTPEHGKIQVKAAIGKTGLEISVIDTGIGITAANHQTIFEAFSPVDGTHTKKEQGAGIGLASVKHLVEMHGGHIHLTSELGRGSTFSFNIPLNKEAEPHSF
jgi:signal transduction histidine kinase